MSHKFNLSHSDSGFVFGPYHTHITKKMRIRRVNVLQVLILAVF